MPKSRRKQEMAEYIYENVEASLPILSYCETVLTGTQKKGRDYESWGIRRLMQMGRLQRSQPPISSS